ncbi:methylamine utilization protein MauE [Kribbella antibiotica]|uniref:Methylamine utilization protein MauE n=1 Tax=Kribbella antibiotica TaxID=190195 RepID=A0A4R4Z6F7_9ACTN|nr:MauE/DoxX family redox-associated membrane protein [Kribbella antibiotica]TDD53748.1 methylamine utilization protein MauE [Kribbella antibiotica]
MQSAELTFRVLLGVVFAVSLVGKLRGTGDFVEATRRLVPVRFARWDRPLAAAVALVELAVLALLVIQPTVGFLLALGLLAAFTVGLAAALRRGESAPCHCFGSGSTPLGRRHVVRNAVLLTIAGLGLAFPAASPPFAELLPAATIAIAAAAIVIRFDDLVELYQPLGANR